MFRRLNKRAQTTAEYAIVIALVIGAVVAMQVYVKRGIQGRIKNVVDTTDGGMFTGEQYEPYYMSSSSSTTQSSTDTTNMQDGGAIGRTSAASVSGSRSQTIGAAQ